MSQGASPSSGAPFAVQRLYDAPGMLLGQLIGGHAGFGVWKDTFFKPESLSPGERESLGDQVLQKMGTQNPLASTLVHLATNPLVWLGLLAAPVGLKAVLEGRPLLETGDSYAETLVKKGGLMHHLGLTNANEDFRNTPMPALLSEVGELIQDRQQTTTARRLAPVQAMMQRHGFRTLTRGQRSMEFGESEAAMALVTRLGGLDEEGGKAIRTATVVPRYFVREDGGALARVTDKGGKVAGVPEEEFANAARWQRRAREHEEKVRDIYEQAKAMKRDGQEGAARALFKQGKALKEKGPGFTIYQVPEVQSHETRMDLGIRREQSQEIIDRLGLEPSIAATRAEYQELERRLVMNEGGEVDARKLDKIFRGYKQGQVDTDTSAVLQGLQGAQGKHAVDLVMHEDVLRAVKDGVITREEHDEMKRALWRATRQENYLPWNTIKGVNVEGAKGLLSDRAVEVGNQELGGPGISGSLYLKTSRGKMLHPEFLSELYEAMPTPQIKDEIRRVEALAKKEAQDGRSVGAHYPDFLESYDKYFRRAHVDLAYHVEAPGEAAVEAQERLAKRHPDAKREWLRTQDGKRISYGQGVTELGEGWAEHVSRADVVDHTTALLKEVNPHLAKELRQVVLPAVLGNREPHQTASMAAFWQAKKTMRQLAESRMGKALAGTGAGGKQFVEGLMKVSDPEVELPPGNTVSGMIARFFYTTHLGLNAPALVMNTMQPIVTVAPVLGMEHTVKGYGRAMSLMKEYTEKRVKQFGYRMISRQERQGIIDGVFPYAKEMDLKGDLMHAIDQHLFNGGNKPRGGMLSRLEEVFMKGFEKSEWMVRATAAHALESAHVAGGHKVDAGFRATMKTFIQQSQFAASPLSTPRALRKLGPLTKQFLGFPIRMASYTFNTMPLMGGQESYLKGLAGVLAAGLGLSAIVYEVGKHALGVDLSRGLFASSAGDLVGSNKYLRDGNDWLPVPPVLSVPHDLIAGIATGDKQMLTSAVARLVPGGVGVMRAVGVGPDFHNAPWPVSLLGKAQQTYAGWGTPLADGRVPVYSGDGRLVDYKRPSVLVARSLGVDFGTFGDSGQLDGYLVKQRDEIVRYRQEYLAALAGNDVGKAQRVAAEFQKKFTPPGQKQGMPLTVTKAQVQAYLANRVTPRTERILDRIPPAAREPYKGLVARSSTGLNVRPEDLMQGASSRRRDRAREQGVSAEQVRRMIVSQQAVPSHTGGGGLSGLWPLLDVFV